MRICILSRDNSPIGFLDNEVPDALHFYDDKLHVYLTGSAHTLELTVTAGTEAAELLAVGNKLAFYYKERPYYLNIMTVSQDETEIGVEAWAYCLELLNEKASAYAPAEAHTFTEYFKTMIFCNDIFEIGVNEVSTYSRKCEFTGDSDTLLKRLYSLASEFDAELEFVPRLNGDYSLDVFVMNVYKEHSDADQGAGERRTDQNFRYGADIDSITKTQDISELYTMIVPTGKDGLTLSSIGERKVYDEDGALEYHHPAGSGVIYAPRACQNFPSAITSHDKYIRYDWSTDYESAESLYGNALAKLKEISTPESTYEIKGSIDVNIGDTITVIDEAFSPPLYLETRVTEQEISFTDPSKNSTTFSNTKELESQIDAALASRVSELEKESEETAAKAAEAVTVANTAAETATAAKSTAETAKTTAESASTTASDAYDRAEAADTEAGEAKTVADTAKTAASKAQTTAANAQTAATEANTAATEAKTAADTAQTTATAAKEATDNINLLIRETTDGVEVAKVDSEGGYTGMRTEQTADSYLVKGKDGTEYARYGANIVKLGEANATAIIDMCNGTTQITSTSKKGSILEMQETSDATEENTSNATDSSATSNATENIVSSELIFKSGYGSVKAESEYGSDAYLNISNPPILNGEAQVQLYAAIPAYESALKSYDAASASIILKASGDDRGLIRMNADDVILTYDGYQGEGAMFPMSEVIAALENKTYTAESGAITPWASSHASNSYSFKLWRVGKVVHMQGWGNLKIPVASSGTLGEYTIPAGFRPVVTQQVDYICGSGGTYKGLAKWGIEPTGALSVALNSNTSDLVDRRCTATWITTDDYPTE